jgi:rfaE bifunctional protein nucleotidyltransferase chain/domain
MILTIKELKPIVAKLKYENKKIVLTNGVFDLLHIGHVNLLEEAKSLGDILIVGINPDYSVKKIKGNKRPINNENHRAKVIDALRSVDFVVIFKELSPEVFIEAIKPDIHVKGEDYKHINLPSRMILKAYGGKSKFIRFKHKISSSELIKKIIEN